tara:strand:- start:131 stop:292 length:162 start_codon:yes stop_codon:yes gene_type:complete
MPGHYNVKPKVFGFSKAGPIYKQAKKMKPGGKIHIDDLVRAQRFLRHKKKKKG